MIDENPLVSVCMPTYNYARFIRDCIESVLAQTFTDWELIIFDDCSTDTTGEIVGEYAKADERIRYVKNERRLGMNGNIKRAAEAGTGKYLKMLCSDDWLAPECLQTLVELMEKNPQVVLATPAEIACNEAGNPTHLQFLFGKALSIIPGEKMLDRVARGQGLGGHSSFLIRSAAYKAVGGYDDSLLYAADYDLGARLCRIGDYLHVDIPLLYARIQSTSSSSINPSKLFDVIDWFEIPRKIFRHRRLGDREWRRYQRLTANLTARYLVNTIVEELRGHHTYARNLRRMLWQYGNFLPGIPLLAVHLPVRIYKRLTGKNKPASLLVSDNAETTGRRINIQGEPS
jgi:glycosyltransferase involved in cell wall biosynthesis